MMPPQTWVSPGVWVAGLLVGLPALLFAPTHYLLAWADTVRAARV
jgi:hypothetical protein